MGFIGSAIGGVTDTISSGIGSIFGEGAEKWSRKLHDPAGIFGGSGEAGPERAPYEKYNPYIIGGSNENQPGGTPGSSRFIDSNKMNSQISKNAAIQKGQNVNAYNAAVGSNRALNPALATYLMGNNLASANQQTANQAQNQSAQYDFNAQQFNAQQEQQTQLANQAAYAQAAGLNSQNYNTMQGINAGIFNQQQQNQNSLTGGLIGGIASIAGSFLSDENEKQAPLEPSQSQQTEMHSQGIQDAPMHSTQSDDTDDFVHFMLGNKKEEGFLNRKQSSSQTKEKPTELNPKSNSIHEFMDKLTPHLFSYKSDSAGNDGGKTHMGIMAQDLEKTEIGKNMIHETPNGKMIDSNHLSGALAASVGALHQRLLKLEDLKHG